MVFGGRSPGFDEVTRVVSPDGLSSFTGARERPRQVHPLRLSMCCPGHALMQQGGFPQMLSRCWGLALDLPVSRTMCQVHFHSVQIICSRGLCTITENRLSYIPPPDVVRLLRSAGREACQVGFTKIPLIPDASTEYSFIH